jgi:phage terminase large subunit GpA-like protein
MSSPMNALTPEYFSLGHLVCDLADNVLRPPERLTVSQAAEKYRKLNNPGSYKGDWKHDRVPYLVDVQDVLTSREFDASVFVGPAQCAKTEAILNWLAHTIKTDPADFILYQTSQTSARDFSRRRVDRLHRHSPEIGSLLMPGKDSDNVYDKHYRNGMMFSLSWPAINEMSGKPIGRVALTDYDRMPTDIDGEGSPFDLARKRTTTFGSFKMTFAESSPGHPILDTKWIAKTAHEAPPCEGILALYNRGDRRRWHWPCPDCGEYFEPEFKLLQWPKTTDILEAGEKAMMACPHCGVLIESKKKHAMNRRGRWVSEGQRVLPSGVVIGTRTRSDIASFWLKGVAAGFASWKTLVMNYLKAEEEFERTGSQEALKSTVNTDQGEPYYPRGTENDRLPEQLKDRGRENPWEHSKVPSGVRFLMAQCDVQKNKFVVQVHGVGVGGDLWVVDRFDIVKSNRKDDDGDTLWVKPGTYVEDWELLREQVMEREYELEDGSGFMSIKLTVCDSGGREGVTTNAYAFWRKLRSQGQHQRFLLLKGEPNVSAPRAKVDYPDTGRKDRTANARGEIPVLFLNVNVLKDGLNGLLDRLDPGGGRIYWSDWLPDHFFSELCVEQRTPKGWENPAKRRNESWDLLTYALGTCVHLRVEHIRWDEESCPSWAQTWDKNVLVRKREQPKPFTDAKDVKYGFAKLAELLG